MFEPHDNLTVKSECPNCKKLITFELGDINEKENFSLRPHNCPKCLKQQLKDWKPKY